MYQVEIKNSAKSDLRKIKQSNLIKNFKDIVDQLKLDPYFPNQRLEKLMPPGAGKYSRRLNIHHRVVYTVDDKAQIVRIYSAWDHY
ncbi:Txe/YoeB family addiction module toxin [Lactiplantibacillus daowaiensis]|uniref:Endoribonuclease YoeB n=1 Tax=Lactiplantibacillus daowaiensis TaxID=2559918 RepID=A0ABW1S2W8_9LACO